MKFSYIKYILISILTTSFSSIIGQNDLTNAISLFNQKKFNEAKEILEEILDDSENNAEANYYLGRTNLMLKDYSEASNYLEEAVELENNNADYHFWLGQAYANDARESSFFSAAFIAPKIRDEFAKTIEIDPNHLSGHIGLANFHLNAPGIVGGDIEEAYKLGNTIMDLDEQSGRLVIINYFVKKEQFDSAEAEIRIIEEKYGSDKRLAPIYNSYGYILINQNRYSDAIKYFEKQVEILPDEPNSYDSLGDGHRSAGNLTEAARHYRKALKINPNFEPSKVNLEEVLEEIESSE